MARQEMELLHHRIGELEAANQQNENMGAE